MRSNDETERLRAPAVVPARRPADRERLTQHVPAGGRPSHLTALAVVQLQQGIGLHQHVDGLLQLQRSAGNRAVTASLQRGTLEEMAEMARKLFSSSSSSLDKKRPSANEHVWHREVAPETPGGVMDKPEPSLVESSGIKPRDDLHGFWGLTESTVLIDYAIRKTKHGRFVAQVVRPRLTIVVKIRPDSEFPSTAAFKAYYQEFLDSGRTRDEWVAIKALEVSSAFTTPSATLFHESQHATNAARDAKRKERKMYAVLSGNYADTPEEARGHFEQAIDEVWAGFPNENGHEIDHIAIYRKQVRRLLAAYETKFGVGG